MKLSTALYTVPLFSLIAMAAFADDATIPSRGGAAAACKQDVQTLCPGVQPGGGRIVACLKSHAEQVSPDCRAAVKAAHGQHQHQSSGGEPAADAPTTN